jgi:hypothetical protein
MNAIIENSANAVWNFGARGAHTAGALLEATGSRVLSATVARTMAAYLRCRPFLLLTGAFLQNFFLYASMTMGCVTLIRLIEHMEEASLPTRIAYVALSILLLGTMGTNVVLLFRGGAIAIGELSLYAMAFGTGLGLGMIGQGRSHAPH